MLSFDDFKNMASDNSLNDNEKVGFPDIYRKGTEENIFPDILQKLNIKPDNEKTKIIMDIGCGCSGPAKSLIEYVRKNSFTLYLIDSKEMLDNLPNEPFIIKIAHEFPCDYNYESLYSKVDYIIVYSVLHHVVYHSNYLKFLDTCIALLKSGGGEC